MLKRAQMSGNSTWASVTPPSVQKWSPFSGFGSMQIDNLHVVVLTSASILTSEVARNRFPFRVKKIFVGFVYTLKQKWFAFSFDFFQPFIFFAWVGISTPLSLLGLRRLPLRHLGLVCLCGCLLVSV